LLKNYSEIAVFLASQNWMWRIMFKLGALFGFIMITWVLRNTFYAQFVYFLSLCFLCPTVDLDWARAYQDSFAFVDRGKKNTHGPQDCVKKIIIKKSFYSEYIAQSITLIMTKIN